MDEKEAEKNVHLKRTELQNWKERLRIRPEQKGELRLPETEDHEKKRHRRKKRKTGE